MKIPETLKLSRLLRKDRRGVALVTVLTVMALTTILVLTFFSLATSEHRASNTYSNGLQAQQVAEEAVNLVIAQIREATTIGTSTAWASQPGAIRNWDKKGEKFAFKLYSDDQMKTLDWEQFQTDFNEAKNWSSKPSHYVDLNEPVIRGEKVYYPIVHPSASTIPSWPKPLGNDKDGVEGFSYNQGTLKLADAGKLGEKAAKLAKAEGHVPMPVKWIYQLADGTLGVLEDSASGGGGTEGYGFRKIAGSGIPSEANPMVARFAFWADDETSKLNINTHAGGLAWDVPKAGGELDMAMGKYQPAQKEWQRYPGHPATTHLGPALAPGVLDIVNDRDAMEMLYDVVPRVVGGGSKSGTRLIDTRRKEEVSGLVADTEPLFPTLDDVIMRADREPHEFPDPKGKPIPAKELSDYLERAKFFVTANSRAPETNMFNLPRVAIWPIYNTIGDDSSSPYMTTFDRLIRYCASMGKDKGGDYSRYEYIFKRENADSSTFDYKEIPRNQILYAYLLKFLTTNVPGYGKSFESKYGLEGSQQILTEIFDYIRTTNLHDDSLFVERFEDAFRPAKDNKKEHLTYTNARDDNNKTIGLKGHGQVVPIKIPSVGSNFTKGFGRFYTISGVQVQVISCAEPSDVGMPAHFGARSYANKKNESISSSFAYQNFPPHPAGITKDGPIPAWLTTLKTTDPVAFDAAFEPTNWNWQLAYLDPFYLEKVVGDPGNRTRAFDPSLTKFNQASLDPGAFQSGQTRLQAGEQLVQGAFLFNFFTPSVGWNSINPDMEIEIKVDSDAAFRFAGDGGMVAGKFDWSSSVPFIGFARNGADRNKWIFATNAIDSAWGGRRYGGTMPFEYTLAVSDGFSSLVREVFPNLSKDQKGNSFSVGGGRSRLTWLDRGYDLVPDILSKLKVEGDSDKIADSYRYDLVTVPFKINGEVAFTGGDVEFRIFHGGTRSEGSAPQGGANKYGVDGDELIQSVTINVPNFREGGGGSRRPMLYDPNLLDSHYLSELGGYFNEFSELEKDSFSLLERNNLGADPGNVEVVQTGRISVTKGKKGTQNPVASGRFAHISVNDRPSPFAIGDIVQSVEIKHGDARMVAGRETVKSGEVFHEHRKYDKEPMAHSQTNAVGAGYTGAAIDDEYLVRTDLPKIKSGTQFLLSYNNRAPLPFGVEKSKEVQYYGDFDNGAGLMIDGPYINKPDEGNTHSLKTKFASDKHKDQWEQRRNYGEFPYFNREDINEAGGPAYFSPNRILSGPGMFGSLPTGIQRDISKEEPWRTLLFRPATDGIDPGFKMHPGGAKQTEGPDQIPDHLIMDLFWMPVVEPYAISEPLSTAGKINMNFQIVPFLHIDRSTALRGIFRSEMMLCIPNVWHVDYKHNSGRGRGYHWRDNPYGGKLQGKRLRSVIVDDTTLKQFTDRFDGGNKIFKSATEICEIHLIPEEVTSRLGLGSKGSVGSYTPTTDQMNSGKYWKDHSLVGDNSRERPYTNIQTRLTTKSNTFLVHYRAQVLKQARRNDSTEYGDWRPELDTVQAEYRGSSLVERYVNPDADDITDFASEIAEIPAGSDGLDKVSGLDKFYRFRVVNPRRFAP